VNTFKKGEVTADQLLSEPRCWTTVDYASIDRPNVEARVGWTATRAGTGHGIVMGLDRTLADGIRLCNAPGAAAALGKESIYATLFFPWPSPVQLSAGDQIDVDLRATLVGGDYTWCWNSEITSRAHSSSVTRFEQSTLLGMPVSPASLRKGSASYRPTLTENGRMARFVLDAMNEGIPLGEIAARLSKEFPTSAREPLNYVTALARRYS
jgi:hypothetical protein